MAVYPQEPYVSHYWQPEAPNGMLEAAQQEKINVTQKEKKKNQSSGVWRKHCEAQGKQLLCHL